MSSLARSVFITGASRGVGLELVRQIVKLPSPPEVLIAACRNPKTATALQDIATVHPVVKIIKLDVERDEEIDAAVMETRSLVGEFGLNLLINNAGIYLEKPEGGHVRIQRRELMQQHFNVNTTSSIIITQKLLPLLEQAASNQRNLPFSCSKAASIVMSSGMGSQTLTYQNQLFTSLHYKCSKSAVDMACILMSQDLKDVGILVFALHPGWVQTDMGGSDATLTPQQSVESILQTLNKAGEKEMGLLINLKGEVMPF